MLVIMLPMSTLRSHETVRHLMLCEDSGKQFVDELRRLSDSSRKRVHALLQTSFPHRPHFRTDSWRLLSNACVYTPSKITRPHVITLKFNGLKTDCLVAQFGRKGHNTWNSETYLHRIPIWVGPRNSVTVSIVLLSANLVVDLQENISRVWRSEKFFKRQCRPIVYVWFDFTHARCARAEIMKQSPLAFWTVQIFAVVSSGF